MGLDVRLKQARLYVCTDTRARQRDFDDFVTAALAGGVDLLQIREKGLAPEQELEFLGRARTIASRVNPNALIAVNDSAELAGRFSADVLHLGQTDGEAAAARRHLSQWALVGRSTHDEEQAAAALADEATDYFCVGPVWATPTKPDYRPVGLELVRHAARVAPPGDVAGKPWFAIGGIDATNLDEVLEAGARRVCVVRAVTQADDPQQAAQELSDRLRQAWRDDPAMKDYGFAVMRRSGMGGAAPGVFNRTGAADQRPQGDPSKDPFPDIDGGSHRYPGKDQGRR